MPRKRFQDLEFAPLLEQSAEVKEAIRVLRNSESVRSYMYSDHEISTAEHTKWLDALEGDDRELPMVIMFGGALVGYVALRHISQEHKTADWAFYIDERSRGSGLGSAVEYKLLELAFEPMQLEKLNCEVLATNRPVIQLHNRFGFKAEGVRRSNIAKGGARIDVVLLGMTKAEWRDARKRFARLLGESE